MANEVYNHQTYFSRYLGIERIKNKGLKNRENPKTFNYYFFGEKMEKNMTFTKKIFVFLIFLGIPEVQLPQKQRFWPSGRVF